MYAENRVIINLDNDFVLERWHMYAPENRVNIPLADNLVTDICTRIQGQHSFI